jgi:cold shock CspA family protein
MERTTTTCLRGKLVTKKDTVMENGYVKFFDSREGKLFGFVVGGDGEDIYFHYSNGQVPYLYEFKGDKSVKFKTSTTPMPYPKMGDRLVFNLSKNGKGPKANPWCFEQDYNKVLDGMKSHISLDEAKKLLADSRASVLEYDKVTTSFGTVNTTTTTVITWYGIGGKEVACGNFTTAKVRHPGGQTDQVVSEKALVIVHPPNPVKYHSAQFQLNEETSELKNLGSHRVQLNGVYESVMWNGGSDYYVVNPANIREMTAKELAEVQKDHYFPELNSQWLRCCFVHGYSSSDTHVVKILAHLGSHD